jgi:hypothetical protein
MLKICILILTYKRNLDLFRVLRQVNGVRREYSGGNEYHIWVADSDSLNPEKLKIKRYCDVLIVNPEIGFDSNIFNYFKNYSYEFDYTLTVSDDDLFNVFELNPFDFIDLSVKSNKGVILFNHYDFKINAECEILISSKHYKDNFIGRDSQKIKSYFLNILPRHIGILYSKASIQTCEDVLIKFKNTHHLYAVPFMLSVLNDDLFYLDYPLLCFYNAFKNDGAWKNHVAIFEGLIKFLLEFRELVNEEQYIEMKEGFKTNYIGNEAWLRRSIEKQGLILPAYENI